MSAGRQFDYEALIDRSIKDFRPVKRLWPVRTRLALWVLFVVGVLALSVGVGVDAVTAMRPGSEMLKAALFLSASIAAAFLALRSAIPGREVGAPELLVTFALICGAFGADLGRTGPMPGDDFLLTVGTTTVQMLGLVAFPWLSLFWAVRRGVPTEPAKTGSLIGVASFCFALAGQHLMRGPSVTNPVISEVLFCLAVTVVSAWAGALWLNWIEHWQNGSDAAEARSGRWTVFGAPVALPAALAACLVGLVFGLRATNSSIAPVPDFDLTIQSYQRALAGFHPNVPSRSIDTMLTAYVDRGMPAYMWDFSAEGFKFVGGRWEPLADGTPTTYTWFRGSRGGVMCMLRQTSTFDPPSIKHQELHHLLFYRYHGFSICLVNVGGYGNFVSVMASPMPMPQFQHLVLAAIS